MGREDLAPESAKLVKDVRRVEDTCGRPRSRVGGERRVFFQSPRLPGEVAGWWGHTGSFHIVPSGTVSLQDTPELGNIDCSVFVNNL